MSMTRSILPATAVALVVSSPSPACAQLVTSNPILEGLTVTSLETAVNAVGIEGEQLAQMISVVTEIGSVLSTVSQVLDVARMVKHAYEILRDYDLDDLAADARHMLGETVPGFDEAQRQWNNISRGMEAGWSGRRYWDRRTYRDVIDDELHAAGIKLEHKATAFPALDIRGVFENIRTGEKAAAEQLVQEHFARAGMTQKRAEQNAAYMVQSEKLKALIKDAERKEQSDLRIMTTNAVSTHQTAVNTQFLRDAKAADIAAARAMEALQRETDELDRKQMAQQQQEFLGIGIVE